MISYKQLIRFIWQQMRLQKWAFFFILLLDSFAGPLENVLSPYIFRIIIDTFNQYESARMAAWGALLIPVIGALSLVLWIEIASRTMGFIWARAMPKLQATIRMEMFDHIQHHSPHYFNERFAGSLANKITDMTTQVDLILQQLWWPIFPAMMNCILGALILWFVNPIIAFLFLSWFGIHLGICFALARPCDRTEHRHGETRSTLLGKIVDSLTNNFAVNLFYRFKQEQALLSTYQNEEEHTNVIAKQTVEKMRCLLSLLWFIALLGILISLIYLWTHHHITTGQVIQVWMTIWGVATVLWGVGSSLPLLFQSCGTAKQAYSVMRDPQDLGDQQRATELKISSGTIVFEDVSFQYDEKKFFENSHVQIKGGEKVGLVGFTGAGKSTFINLILRFFPPQSGKILIDGQDIANSTLESLRKQIALIPQDPVLFHRTLRENICYGKPEATEAEIVHAAKLAHCDEFIRSRPKGYETKVGERGTKLSGGEKQRIAIARAILVDAPILILDEATSSLDSLTERYIQDSLAKLMQHRTTIAIAHRLSTLSRMDRILVFDQGRIVEEGTHAALLHQGGLYAQMWNMQVCGFLPDLPEKP